MSRAAFLAVIVLALLFTSCGVRIRVGIVTPPGSGPYPSPNYWYIHNALIDCNGTYFNDATGDVSFLVNDNGRVRRVEVPPHRVRLLLRIYEYRSTVLDAEMTDSYHASEATIYCHTQSTYRYWQDRLVNWRRR
ncbi:MAG: hypothetical protein A2745_02475 [Candidatus Harrisonbacteria bacterium RIFCSPHIGHO2_01_FULL_44_13]|uniref:Uncharacterized protein n=1 Tax=Candidatus Harrisonbacteria bacterium RIFCSPLOWO2_01_FULL_44_18 TaxID=1798407 RepID=A0A1G1ZND3_9BACT|nr:MAG: hypothetical protein A2745_02475 [Candidatus Harrisonbacteria bacterium RIFCSPHIGHO2_01_FULL_44_13]OGY65929.1 MAG: hypothetical protein A3A16_00900 [Candidatus Harrisonbacteria bacterium RIFCSPLOWO2_01_FULL_44_18]